LGIRAFSKCRNEILRLPAFLAHYRRLGVERFFIVDNNSTDGSAEYLSAQPDVELSSTAERFSATKGGTAWLNQLLAKSGTGSWCVTVDIDELLVYPGSESATLPAFTAHLDRSGCTAFGCILLDLYPDGPLAACRYQAGEDLYAAAPLFDAGPYSRVETNACPGVVIRGGMRERVFYPEWRRGVLFSTILRLLRRSPAPCLTKVPLIRWTAASAYLYANHFASPHRVAPETGALLHFKFLQDFHARALHESSRREYYKGGMEYRRYARVLQRNPAVSLRDGRSVRFTGTSQLVELGLMQDSDAWKRQRAMGRT